MEDSSFKNRNLLVLLFEMFIIIVAIGGLTFATSKFIGSSTIITFGEYKIDYIGKTDVEVSNLEPISDKLINYDSKEGVIRLEFSLRGVEENNDEDLIYDIMLNNLDIDCSLLNEYTKWQIYKNGELLESGNFSPKFDGNVLTDNVRLTSIQQDLPKYNEDYDKYVLLIWISEACEDITNCNLVDQSEIVNSVMNMKVFVALSGGEKVKYERVPNMDSTCVNKPILYDRMIPVYYDDGEWKVANKTNSDVSKLWYNYGESRWANAVIVNSDKYLNSMPGTIILKEDILGHYVWIPRYKYKIWNDGTNFNDSYNAYEEGIDIVFESGVNNTIASRVDEYLTHPAFSDKRGFWISKYEISDDNKFIPNANIMVNTQIDEYTNIINNLSNVYGLNDIVDSHIINDLEWGATLYLSHSKYGLCKDNKCYEMGMNNSYITEANIKDTTTGNVYGVYDMSGTAGEYTLTSNSIFGTSLNEVKLSENETWYNGIYLASSNSYTVRGGVDKGAYSSSGIGMENVSTRSVLVNK